MLSRNLQSSGEYSHVKIKDLRHISLMIELTVLKCLKKSSSEIGLVKSRKREWRMLVDSIFPTANIPHSEIATKLNVRA